jgi:aspartyl-tRNA(Asn)/glutamyl-tRNA(Gln) amidotransferase subunit A
VYESDVSRILLKECGAVLIGITNMDEFGMGSLGTYNGSVPTCNALPWMQRIAMIAGPNTSDLDRHFLDQIIGSTSCNPHNLKDDGLQQLLDEVIYWNSPDMEVKDKSKSPLLSPGGSSSGAAVATAHGSSLLSIGTDTGGSLRLPAAWTSTVGFKPTYGSISRYGVVSYASSLDTVGFLTGSSECAEIAWKCLGGAKEPKKDWAAKISRDSTARVYHSNETLSEGDGEPKGTKEKPLDGIRIGIPAAFSLHESPSLISSAWSRGANFLQSKGATLVSIPESKVSSQWVKLSCAAYYVLACAEASSNLSRYDGVRYGKDHDAVTSDDHTDSVFADMTILEQHISATRASGFGDEVQRRVLAGTSVLSSDRFHTHYEAAAIVRAKLSQSLENVFRCSVEEGDSDEVDAILVPTALSFPVVLDPRKEARPDSTSAFANDVMTIPISLGGFPSISVPIHESKSPDTVPHSGDNSPVGLQLFGPRGSEELVLKTARTLEQLI